MPFLNTNTKKFRAKVFRLLLDSVYDLDGGTDQERAAYIWQRFNAEYNYAENKRRIPNLQARVAEWLSGMALSVPYTYADIIATSERWHETTLTERERDRVCEQWFSFLAQKLLQSMQAYGVDIMGAY